MFTRMFGQVTVTEVLYGCHDEISAEGLLDHALQQSRNFHFLEVLVKKDRLIKSKDRTVTCAAMTALKPRYILVKV